MKSNFHSLGPAEKLHVPENFDSDTRVAVTSAINDERVINSTSLHEQIGWLCTILRPDGVGIALAKIGALFSPSKSHATVSRHFESFSKQQQAPHRPELLNQEQYAVLAEKINNTIRDTGHPSLTNVITFINESFQIDASRPTAARILDRIGFKLMKARPIEEDRYTCSLDDIIAYYTKLAELLATIPCGFCFNLDESGIQRFVDAKDTYLIVPKTYPDHELTFPVYRAGKRITLLHCISTDGTYTKPLFVLPRKTLDDDIFSYINPNSCCFCTQENGFLTTELFEYWLHMCFFPELERKREQFKYQGPALLIMDGFKGHTKAYEENKELFKDKNVEVLFIPPHSSDQVQPLDLLGFNLLKLAKNKSNIAFQEGTSDQTKEIVRIMNALESVSTSVLITKAWHAAGIFRKPVEKFSFDQEIFIQYHEVDMQKAQKIRTHDEEGKNRIKAFAENLVHSNQHTTERIFPNPSRVKAPSSLIPAQIQWFRMHRDDFV